MLRVARLGSSFLSERAKAGRERASAILLNYDSPRRGAPRRRTNASRGRVSLARSEESHRTSYLEDDASARKCAPWRESSDAIGAALLAGSRNAEIQRDDPALVRESSDASAGARSALVLPRRAGICSRRPRRHFRARWKQFLFFTMPARAFFTYITANGGNSARKIAAVYNDAARNGYDGDCCLRYAKLFQPLCHGAPRCPAESSADLSFLPIDIHWRILTDFGRPSFPSARAFIKNPARGSASLSPCSAGQCSANVCYLRRICEFGLLGTYAWHPRRLISAAARAAVK